MDSRLSWILSKGYLGVDFFFVLSGFIIYYSNVDQPRTRSWATRYSWSRLTRIFVPYLPVGLAIAVAYSIEPRLAGPHVWNWFSTVTLLPSSAQPALGVAWTLQHEVIFYGLMLVFLFADRVMLGCLAWFGVLLGAQLAGLGDVPGLALIEIEFIMGITVAWCFHNNRGGHRAILLVVGTCLCIAALAVSHPNARLLFGAGIALLMLLAVRAETSGHFRAPALGLLLGNASYALYLIHVPLMRLLARLLQPTDGLTAFTLLVGASIVATLAYHFWFERPALELARRLGRASGATGAAGLRTRG